MLSQIQTETSSHLVKADPYMAWCICNSVIHHFKSDYNAVKYRYKMPWFKPEKYHADRMKWWYEGVCRKLVHQDKIIKLAYVNANHGNLHPSEFDFGLYEELEGWLQSQGYNFEKALTEQRKRYTDVSKIKDFRKYEHHSGYPYKDFDFHCKPEHDVMTPPFASGRMDFRVRVKTNLICGWADQYNKSINTETLHWPNTYKAIKRHEPFLSQWINIKKMKKIAYKVFTS